MAAGAPITYKVTGVTQDSQFTGQSTPVTGKRVSFSTSSGYDGSVFVPDGVFADKDAVRRMIEGEVRIVAAAQAITGQLSS